MADAGLAELGTSRPTGWDQPGECIKSVQRWVAAAGGSFGGGGVISSYVNSGAQEVSLASAVKGDVIQYTSGSGNDNDWSHVHTMVVINNLGNGRFDIVQSNSPAGSGLVTRLNNMMPSPASGWVSRVWRFGTVSVPTPTDGDGDGTPDSSDACPTQPGPSSTGGCPDGDGDWIRDSQDLCDLVKGTASNHGCPNSVTQVSGDLDGDGKDDIIAISRNLDNSPGISWLRSTSAGSPSLADPVGLLSLPAPAWNVDGLKWIGDGDFNGDGKSDVFVASGSGAGQVVMYMFLSTGTGLSGPTLVKMPPHPGWQWDRLEYFAGDPDGDGKDDIIAISRGMDNAPTISLLRSTSVGMTASLADPISLKAMPGPAWHVDYLKWAVGDFDGDGKDDLFAASGSVSDPVSMYIFRSTGTALADPILVKQPSFAAWKWDRLTFMAGDVDDDGKRDVIAISRDYDNSAGIHWFQSTSSPSSMSLADPTFLRSVPAPAWNMGHLKWAVGDYTGGGKADVFAASGSLSDPVSMYVFPTGGSGAGSTLGAPVLVKQPPYPGWQWARLQF